MKRKVWAMIAIVILIIMPGICEAEVVSAPVVQTTVDYNGTPSEWIYILETEEDTLALLTAIDQCRYGAAGASLSQADAACKLLQLTDVEDIESVLTDYLNKMNATQLDYFSFQWQMRMIQAQEMLSNPDDYSGILEDSGNEGFDISAYSLESLSELNALVMNELAVRNVSDVWKQYPDIEPFAEAAAWNRSFQNTDFYSVCTDFSKDEVEQFAKEIKKLILSSNWMDLSEHIAYPITIGDVVYKDSESLVNVLSEAALSAGAIESIQNEDCTDMFCKYSGIMMGNGEVWISEVLNEDGTSAGLKVIALEIPESTQAFRAGTWISQGEDAAFYYFFDADGVSGRTASLETGIGLGFCYEIDGENIVFRIGAEDAEIKGSLSITDADHAEIIWADGRKDSMTFVSEEGSDTFHFYTNEELCAMAIAYYTDATGEVAPLAAADLGTDTVTIQLYNNLGDHNSTYAWYQVNRLTGKVIDVN